MYYVYVLVSQKDNHFYTGYTENLKKRVSEHELGKITSTKDRRPLQLVYYVRVRGSGGCAEEGAIPQDDLGEKIPEEQVAVVFEIVSWMI